MTEQKNQQIKLSSLIAKNNQQPQIKSSYLVDPENGPYKTIQAAIDVAESGCVIQVVQGLYQENLLITRPNLRIEPKDKQGDVILVVGKGPTISINLERNDKATIIGLKLSHCGSQDLYDDLTANQKELASTYANQNDPEKEIINVYPLNETNLNCIIYLQSGRLFLEDSFLSLNYIVKTTKKLITGIIQCPSSELIINRCEIRGNKSFATIGIMTSKAYCIIKESKIHTFLTGGVMVKNDQQSMFKLQACSIYQCGFQGILVCGKNNQCMIQNCTIENNSGAGIRVGIANKVKITESKIRYNQIGIEIISADPFIKGNIIEKNHTDGIYATSHLKYRCDGIVKDNMISGNKENGIKISGQYSFLRVEDNKDICYNKQCGIKTLKNSHSTIVKNVICRNICQGILLTETSSAVIERNQISENIKANIAMGGNNSVNTYIIENKIYGGRCEGIFCIEGGRFLITRNEIYDNNDGVILITSSPEMFANYIHHQKANGILAIKDSRPFMVDNRISHNQNIGLYIRDKSHGRIIQNTIQDNEIQLVVENYHETLKIVDIENNIKGDCRVPSNFICNIF